MRDQLKDRAKTTVFIQQETIDSPVEVIVIDQAAVNGAHRIRLEDDIHHHHQVILVGDIPQVLVEIDIHQVLVEIDIHHQAPVSIDIPP